MVVAPVVQEKGMLRATVQKLSAVQLAAIVFSSGLILATMLLGLQYVIRYRKYHIAQADDHDSLADPSGMYKRNGPGTLSRGLRQSYGLTRSSPLYQERTVRMVSSF